MFGVVDEEMRQLNWQIVDAVGNRLKILADKEVGGKSYWKVQTAAALAFLKMSENQRDNWIQEAEAERRLRRPEMGLKGEDATAVTEGGTPTTPDDPEVASKKKSRRAAKS